MPFVLILKTGRTIRNHWKKSLFASGLLSYGFVYTKNYIETQDLMRAYCEKAAKLGNHTIPVNLNPRHITVILNPTANKRKAAEDFDNYCAPLLHLAGIFVDIKKTESEGHAKTVIDTIGSTDAIVVAGGDGTLSEVITGLLRKTNEDATLLVPLGILPLGKTNSVAKSFFPTDKKLEKVKSLVEATMAVIEEAVKPIDVMKIEVLSEDEKTPNKPVYAVGSLKWGAYRDAAAKKDSYWYFGPLRKYATYIFNGYKSSLSWNCNAVINYSIPCEGCSNCYRRSPPRVQHASWFHKFIKEEDDPQAKYLLINNAECQVPHEKEISTADMALLTSNVIPNSLNSNFIPKLVMEIGPKDVPYLDFVKNGFKLEKGEKKDIKEVIEAKFIKINPESKGEMWFSIDDEYYEMKPIKITLLAKLVKMFCKNQVNIN